MCIVLVPNSANHWQEKESPWAQAVTRSLCHSVVPAVPLCQSTTPSVTCTRRSLCWAPIKTQRVTAGRRGGCASGRAELSLAKKGQNTKSLSVCGGLTSCFEPQESHEEAAGIGEGGGAAHISSTMQLFIRTFLTEPCPCSGTLLTHKRPEQAQYKHWQTDPREHDSDHRCPQALPRLYCPRAHWQQHWCMTSG